VIFASILQLSSANLVPSGISPSLPYTTEKGARTFYQFSFNYDKNIENKA
jgi:hypothetical protein